jgi:hypothetical protein
MTSIKEGPPIPSTTNFTLLTASDISRQAEAQQLEDRVIQEMPDNGFRHDDKHQEGTISSTHLKDHCLHKAGSIRSKHHKTTQQDIASIIINTQSSFTITSKTQNKEEKHRG